MDEHDWCAYPHFAPPEQFPAFKLAKGIFYNNAWENAASAMVRRGGEILRTMLSFSPAAKSVCCCALSSDCLLHTAAYAVPGVLAGCLSS